jgi:hypothetical protein
MTIALSTGDRFSQGRLAGHDTPAEVSHGYAHGGAEQDASGDLTDPVEKARGNGMIAAEGSGQRHDEREQQQGHGVVYRDDRQQRVGKLASRSTFANDVESGHRGCRGRDSRQQQRGNRFHADHQQAQSDRDQSRRGLGCRDTEDKAAVRAQLGDCQFVSQQESDQREGQRRQRRKPAFHQFCRQQVEAPRSDRDSDQDQKRHPGDHGMTPDEIGPQTEKEQQPQDQNDGRFA